MFGPHDHDDCSDMYEYQVMAEGTAMGTYETPAAASVRAKEVEKLYRCRVWVRKVVA